MKVRIIKRGFTLIELLVVIAIIGVLATIVIASLSDSRERAKDAAVMQSLSSYRNQIELDFNNSYTGLCDSSSFLDYAQGLYDVYGADVYECEESSNAYRVVTILPSQYQQFISFFAETAFANGENAFCINSLGEAKRNDYDAIMAASFPSCPQSLVSTTPVYDWVCYDGDPEYTGCADISIGVAVPLSICFDNNIPFNGCEPS